MPCVSCRAVQALHVAAYYGQREVVGALLEAGANPWHRNRWPGGASGQVVRWCLCCFLANLNITDPSCRCQAKLVLADMQENFRIWFDFHTECELPR